VKFLQGSVLGNSADCITNKKLHPPQVEWRFQVTQVKGQSEPALLTAPIGWPLIFSQFLYGGLKLIIYGGFLYITFLLKI
jgi:hypothetical protein